MTLLQALLYFVREAFSSLVRSWKISLLAILTIAVSLVLTGLFLIIGSNLSSVIAQWQGESKIVVYLKNDATLESRAQLDSRIAAEAWVTGTEQVSAEQAAERFAGAFPDLSDLLVGWDEQPLPASIEVDVDWQQLDRDTLATWLASLRAESSIEAVDDDRNWLDQVERIALFLQGLGWALGGILLLTAVFTIASVIRLTAYLYRDEIAVMRTVGATEFYIRGPFYVEGLLQGLFGGLLALAALRVGHLTLHRGEAPNVLVSLLAEGFLAPLEQVALAGFGALAGLVGAVTSLRREALGSTDPSDDQ